MKARTVYPLLVSSLLALGCGGPESAPQRSQEPGDALELPAPRDRPPVPRPQGAHDGYRDDSEGAVATVVYVTETKEADGAATPSALVFCSDPEHSLFERRPTVRVNVKRMFRDQMELLLVGLERRGFEDLPWKEQGYNLEHGAQRAFYLYRDGKRHVVYKQTLDDAGLRTFSEIERFLINATMAVD